jgi:hypothetical protein
MRIHEIALAALACASPDSALMAQGLEAFASRFSASGVAGVLRIDDQGLGFSSGELRYEGSSDLAPLVGATVGFTVASFLTIEAHYARAAADIGMQGWRGDVRLPEPELEEGRVMVDLYGFRGRASFPPEASLRGSAIVGRGTAEVDVDVAILQDGERVGPSGSTAREPMWEFGGGVEWRPGAHWEMRAEVIDHVQLCEGETHSEINICGREGSIDRLHHTAITVAATLRL